MKYKCWIEYEKEIEAKNEDEALENFESNLDLSCMDFRVEKLK